MDTSFERVSDGKDEWLTPPSLIQSLGDFDLDPCAPITRPWDTAKRHYSVLDNGLQQPWFGRVWCNPPYGSETGVWLKKLAQHGDGVALVFGRTDTKAFHSEVFAKASAILFMRGRLKFHHVDGTPAKNSAGAPSVLIAYGEQSARMLEQSTIDGFFTRIN